MYFFVIAGFSWLIAQIMKVMSETIITRKFEFKRLWGDGGYPSCHSSCVTGLLVSVASKTNFSNILSTNAEAMVLGVTAIFWMVTIQYALGTRKAQGDMGKCLNLYNEYFAENFDEAFFKAFPMFKKGGHLPHEVIAGIITGVVTAMATMRIIDQGDPLMAIVSCIIGLTIIITIGIKINKKNHRKLSK